MNKKALIGIIITLLSLLGFFIYRQLGGFSDMVFSVEHVGSYHILGIPFEGRMSDPRLEKYFFDIKKLKEGKALEGDFVVVNYEVGEEMTKKGEVKQFIGILVSSRPAAFRKKELGYLYLPASAVVRTEIASHNLVMPKPNRIQHQAAELARQEGKVLKGISIEKYLSDRSLVVEYFLD